MGFMILLIAGFFLFGALRLFKNARVIEDTPTSKIRSATQGYVELYGTTKCMDGMKIKAPLSGQPCVWYSYIVEAHTPNAGKQWGRVESGVSDKLFLIEDETGVCAIDPWGAEVTPSSKSQWYSKEGEASDKLNPPQNFLPKSKLRSGKRHRYTEMIIDVNDPIYAIGEFCAAGSESRNKKRDKSYIQPHERKRIKDMLVKLKFLKDREFYVDERGLVQMGTRPLGKEAQPEKPVLHDFPVLKKPDSLFLLAGIIVYIV